MKIIIKMILIFILKQWKVNNIILEFVPKNIKFIIAIHKLYTKYPELEAKKTGTYVSNGNKINLFDTIQDNGLENGNIIIIINKVD